MPQLLYNGRFDPKTMPLSSEEIIDYFVEADSSDRLVLIVPTGKLVETLKKRYINKYFQKYGKPSTKTNIFTLQKFAEHCYRQLFGKDAGRVISEPYYLTLIEEAIEKSDLQFFRSQLSSKKSISIALVARLAAVIFGIKEDGILPSTLLKDLESYVPNQRIDRHIGGVKEPKRLRDIAEIYGNYQDLLGDKLLDKAQVIIALNNALKLLYSDVSADSKSVDAGFFPSRPANEDFPIDQFFADDAILLFYGFSEFKLPEVEFLAHFATSQKAVAINLDYTEFNGPLFGNLRETASRLMLAGFNNKTVLDEPLSSEPIAEDDVKLNPSRYLRRWLFNSETDIRNTYFEKSVKIIAASNAMDEVRTIAKIVHHLVKADKIPISDICISMRSPENYSPLFREVFTLNNIPIYITDRFHLSNSQLVTAIIGVLDMVIAGYRKTDLLKTISSSYLKFSDKEAINSSNIVSISQQMRIFGGHKRGGKNSWIDKIDSRIKFAESQLIDFSKYSSDENDSYRTKKYIERLSQAKADLELVFAKLNFDNASYLPDEINALIKNEIIANLSIKDNIFAFFEEIKSRKNELENIEYIRLMEEVEKDAAALHKFIELVDEMTAVANERSPDKKIKLEDFTHKLKVAVSSEKYQIKEKGGWGVTITAVEQTRGIPYKAMILCGAIDGQFPLSYRTETMLGKILPFSESRHSESEKILFYQFLTNNPELLDSGEQKIFITYPEFKDNEELVSSTFLSSLSKVSTLNLLGEQSPDYSPKWYHLNELRSAIENNNISERQQKQIDELPWLDYLTEKSELLKYYCTGEYADYQSKSNETNIDMHYVSGINQFVRKAIEPENLDKELLPELANEHLENYINKAFSISEFEEYVQCPQKYFIKRLLGIADRQDDSVELTPLEKGEVLHVILFKFYSMLLDEIEGDEPIKLIKLDSDKREYYLKILLEIAENELESLDYSHVFFDLEKAALLGNGKNIGLIEYWLDAELERTSDELQDFFPALFEHSFGMGKSKGTNKLSEPVLLSNGVKVKGKIDRIEFDDKLQRFIIADYKTNIHNLPNIKDIEKGKKFQIPIYLAASKIFLARQFGLKNIEAEGGIYYGFNPYTDDKKNVYTSKNFLRIERHYDPTVKKAKFHIFVVDAEKLQEYIDLSLQTIKQKTEDMANGIFAKIPDLFACQYCSYQSLCKLNDSKMITVQIDKEEEIEKD